MGQPDERLIVGRLKRALCLLVGCGRWKVMTRGSVPNGKSRSGVVDLERNGTIISLGVPPPRRLPPKTWRRHIPPFCLLSLSIGLFALHRFLVTNIPTVATRTPPQPIRVAERFSQLADGKSLDAMMEPWMAELPDEWCEDVFVAAHELGSNSLKKACSRRLIASLLPANVAHRLRLAAQYDDRPLRAAATSRLLEDIPSAMDAASIPSDGVALHYLLYFLHFLVPHLLFIAAAVAFAAAVRKFDGDTSRLGVRIVAFFAAVTLMVGAVVTVVMIVQFFRHLAEWPTAVRLQHFCVRFGEMFGQPPECVMTAFERDDGLLLVLPPQRQYS